MAREPVMRWPRWVYARGTEPDARFSMANERTFLAWIRTALALFATGVALEALNLPIRPGWRTAGAVVLVLVGLLAAAQAWFGWARTERAVRMSTPLPGRPVTAVVSAGVAVAMVLVAIGLWTR